MRYVEKGETLLVRKQEFFINDCQPRGGVVDANTVIEIETGFS